MVYVEQYFRKAPPLTEADVVEFISRLIEESLTIDYKDIKVYQDPDKLSVAVSAFANSAGGLLLLGVSEQEYEGYTSKKIGRLPGGSYMGRLNAFEGNA